MIITEINKIDTLVECLIKTSKGIVSVDINDYKLVKTSSSSIKAIELELSELSDATIGSLDDAMLEAGCAGVGNILLCVSGVRSGEGANSLTLGKMRMLVEHIQANVGGSANIIWGASDCEESGETIKVVLILGYSL